MNVKESNTLNQETAYLETPKNIVKFTVGAIGVVIITSVLLGIMNLVGEMIIDLTGTEHFLRNVPDTVGNITVSVLTICIVFLLILIGNLFFLASKALGDHLMPSE